jgi:hypothetical protein
LNTFAWVTKLTGYLRGKLGYILGTFPGSFIAGNPIPDVLVRYPEYYYDKFKMGTLVRERVADLQLAGGGPATQEGGLDPATLAALRENTPPIVTPPVTPPDPPVDPPPVDPPEDKPMTIKMSIEQKAGTPVSVGDWFEAGVPVVLHNPTGVIIGKTKTGAKGSEFGPNSFEAAYNQGDGQYRITIGDNDFYYVLSGSKRNVRLHFERTDTPPPVVLVRLVSKPMGRIDAEDVLLTLDADSETRGWFKIEAVS